MAISSLRQPPAPGSSKALRYEKLWISERKPLTVSPISYIMLTIKSATLTLPQLASMNPFDKEPPLCPDAGVWRVTLGGKFQVGTVEASRLLNSSRVSGGPARIECTAQERADRPRPVFARSQTQSACC